ncbi:MAG: diguanylate cyclase [Pseudomonadota bacterium]
MSGPAMSPGHTTDEGLLTLVRTALRLKQVVLFWPDTGRMELSAEPTVAIPEQTWLSRVAMCVKSGQASLAAAEGWHIIVDEAVEAKPTLLLQTDAAELDPRADTFAQTVFSVLESERDAATATLAVERAQVVIDGVERMAEIGIWQVDLASRKLSWSDVTYKIHGVTREDFTPDIDRAVEFYPEDVRSLVSKNIGDAIEAGAGFSFVLPFRRADGELRTVRSVGHVIGGPDGEQLYGIFQDITDEKEAELRLWWTANHDSLTKLPNRMLFQERLNSALTIAGQVRQSVGLILADIDHFKAINDVYGHEAGDELLREVAERLSGQMRQGDTLARLGGDEFAIIVNDLHAADDLARPLDRLMAAAEIDFVYRDIEIPVKLSLGGAVFPRDAHNERELYRNADLALLETKAERTRRGTLYQQSHGAERESLESLLRRIREAVAMGAIVPHFQPVFDLRTGCVASVEVFARLAEGDDLINAAALEPAFEDAELAPQIGICILEKLRQDWPKIDADLRRATPLSINGSSCELQNLNYVEALDNFIDEMSGLGTTLILEVSSNPKNVLPSQVTATFQKLLDKGLTFGLDRLAAGFEALVEAPDLRVQQIKARTSMLTDPATQVRSSAMIGGMIKACRTLGVQLVATRIETAQELERLRDLGYTLGQGFFFCPPMTFEDLKAFLETDAAERSSTDGETRAVS